MILAFAACDTPAMTGRPFSLTFPDPHEEADFQADLAEGGATSRR